MSKRKPVVERTAEPTATVATDSAAFAIQPGDATAYRHYAAVFEAPPDQKGAIVSARMFDGGDVELTVNGNAVKFDDGIILRWGRKR